MRTTLDIDGDLIAVLRDIAKVDGTTLGRVASDLIREAITQPPSETVVRNGVPLLPASPPGTRKVTVEMVNEWLNEME